VFELTYIILATIIVSLLSFVGIFTLSLKEKKLNKILLILIGLSAGTLMGGAFLHLLPEAIEGDPGPDAFLIVLSGFIILLMV